MVFVRPNRGHSDPYRVSISGTSKMHVAKCMYLETLYLCDVGAAVDSYRGCDEVSYILCSNCQGVADTATTVDL